MILRTHEPNMLTCELNYTLLVDYKLQLSDKRLEQ